MTSDAAPAPTSARRPTAGDRPMTRRSCLISLVIWLLVMTLPIFAFVLAVRSEIAWRRGSFVEDRVWLVRAPGGPGEERANGLAYSKTRITRPAASDGARDAAPICARTQVYFFLWRGRSETLEYCQCYRPAEQGSYEPIGKCS